MNIMTQQQNFIYILLSSLNFGHFLVEIKVSLTELLTNDEYL